MRIKSIHVENFKSLVDFDLNFEKLTCLIGLNGSGKSTVLQFIDFIGQQVRGDMKGWLDERGWKSTDLKSRMTQKKNIEFEVTFDGDGEDLERRWKCVFNPQTLRCTHESIWYDHASLEVSERKVKQEPIGISLSADDDEPQWEDISFDYQGSILSQLRESVLADELRPFKHFVANIHSLDMLSPHHLRQRTRESAGSLGLGGQKLASFLFEMGADKRLDLIRQLKKAYPQLEGLAAKSLRSGWKQLEVSEKYEGMPKGLLPKLTTEAHHVNDGLLRLIAILAELQSSHDFVLFDEIENGINPELVEFVLDALINAEPQVVVTTHSPMILNYLDDERARRGVVYLYRTKQGHAKSIPFFSIPSLKKKLAVMGPGEAFVDTNLTDLSKEIAEMTKEEV